MSLLPPGFNRTDKFVAGWIVLTPLTLIHVSTLSAPLLATHVYNLLLYLIGAAIAYRDERVRGIIILGTVAGVVELVADFYLVSIGTLTYPFFVAKLLESPLYMPLSWAIAITQLGYLGFRLDETYGRRAGIVGPSLGATLLIGFYESFARNAGIWAYEFAPLAYIGNAPVFIIAAAALMFSTLVFFVRQDRPVLAGVGFGVVILVSYVVSYSFFSLF